MKLIKNKKILLTIGTTIFMTFINMQRTLAATIERRKWKQLHKI